MSGMDALCLKLRVLTGVEPIEEEDGTTRWAPFVIVEDPRGQGELIRFSTNTPFATEDEAMECARKVALAIRAQGAKPNEETP